MFLKLSELKKLMKRAYKDGMLIIGNAQLTGEDSEGLIISGGWWAFGIEYEHAPKELKAAVMELGGEIPFDGHCYRALSEGNQEHIGFTEHSNPATLFKNCTYDMTITKMAIHFLDSVRLLQNEANGHIVGIKNKAIELIDLKSIDYDNGEYEPIGPRSAENDIICWGNNMCYLAVWPYKLLDEENDTERKMFIKELEQISLLS